MGNQEQTFQRYQDYLAKAEKFLIQETFDAKSHQKDAISFATLAYDYLRDVISSEFYDTLDNLDFDERYDAIEARVELPYSLAHFRQEKHLVDVSTQYHDALIHLYDVRNQLKAIPVVKPVRTPKTVKQVHGEDTNRATHNGTCQICGRRQAFDEKTGTIAKHGYTVDHGFFNGTCGGSDRKPLEHSTVLTEQHINSCQEHIQTCSLQLTPELWKEAKVDREAQVKVFKLEQMIRNLQYHVDFLKRLVHNVHGQPLLEREA